VFSLLLHSQSLKFSTAPSSVTNMKVAVASRNCTKIAEEIVFLGEEEEERVKTDAALGQCCITRGSKREVVILFPFNVIMN